MRAAFVVASALSAIVTVGHQWVCRIQSTPKLLADGILQKNSTNLLPCKASCRPPHSQVPLHKRMELYSEKWHTQYQWRNLLERTAALELPNSSRKLTLSGLVSFLAGKE